jgi:hypothetical protein
MIVSWGKRASDRVSFERGYAAQIMGIDGTWRRDCTILDVSASGVQLIVKGSIAGLELKEFFLLLSSTGLAYRRCELARIDGERIGARFLQTTRKKVTSSSKRHHAESEH